MKIVLRRLSHLFQIHQKCAWTLANNSDGFRFQFEDADQWLNQTIRAIAHVLIGNSDPCIWQKSDRDGNTWWMIDNPLIGTRFHTLSEEEVRTWIEQHDCIQPHSLPGSARDVNPLITGW